MSVTRIYLVLESEERRALGKLAQAEMRDVRDQARFIVCQELKRRGLIEPDKQPEPARQGATHEQR